METFVIAQDNVVGENAFIVANIQATNGGRGTIEIKVTSVNNEVRVTKASVHYYTGGDVHVPFNSCSMLAKIGDRYEINVSQTNPTVTGTYSIVMF